MLVSLEWLGQYVNLQGLTPEAIAEALTHAGLEVEAIQRTGASFSGVVVGKIQAIEKHPNADKLRLVTVLLGESQDPEAESSQETAKVVCGAPNVREGILIPFAKLGATVLNRKDGTTFVLEAAKIRGVESSGMICSLEELGLETFYPKPEDGIWPLDDHLTDENIGQDLVKALKIESDALLETAPTANRGDLMSMMGVAREIAALFDRELHLPEFRQPSHPSGVLKMGIKIESPEVCHYYAGASLRNLKIGPSPEWLVKRLAAVGIRTINNVVDITNYVMIETGQPLHAFDQDKLAYTLEIGVRRGTPGEMLKTLDGIDRTLTSESVVITNNNHPIALAGVMGGESTQIDGTTHNVFLESAYFPPPSNRRSAKSVGIRTDASARFERGVDPGNAKGALYRAVELLKELAKAEYVNMIESSHKPLEEKEVTLRYKRVESILGVAIEKETILKTLKKLGFLLKPSKEPDKIGVTIPTFRQQDISREIDLIEEIIRIYGYDKVPYTLPKKSGSAVVSFRRGLVRKLHRAMQGSGLQEVATTSLIGPGLLERTGFTIDEQQAVRVSNSHSEDHTILRQSLIPNLLEIAKFNQAQGNAQGNEGFWIYEMGRTYYQKGKPSERNTGVVEKLCLSGLLMGSSLSGTWHQKETVDFYMLKGILDSTLSQLLPHDAFLDYEGTQSFKIMHPGKTAQIALNLNGKKTVLGWLGTLHPVLQETLKMKQPVFCFELDVEALFKTLKNAPQDPIRFKASAYQAVKRDMAFSSPESLSHQAIVQVIQQVSQASSPSLVKNIELFDEYRGKQLESGLRSLAYRITLQSDETTLTDQTIDALMQQIKTTLSEKLPVTFR